MSSIETNESSTLSHNNVTDRNQPTYPDGTPIQWDGIDAHIDGNLFETGKFYKRNGKFQTFFKHRAVPLSNGKLAVDSLSAVYFVSGKIVDNHGFDDPAPPTATRLTKFNATRTALGRSTAPELTSVAAPYSGTIVLSVHHVEQEDSMLLQSLTFVFGHAEPSDEILDVADGSGDAMLKELRRRSANADRKDKALASATYHRVIRDGVGGELTLATFKLFIKEYKTAKRNMPATARQSDDAEAEMVSLVALKDPMTREIFDLKATASPPTNLDTAVTLLTGILRGRARSDQIEEAVSGAKPASLIATEQRKALAALGTNASARPIADITLETLVAAVKSAIADPRKTLSEVTKDKDKPPLDI